MAQVVGPLGSLEASEEPGNLRRIWHTAGSTSSLPAGGFRRIPLRGFSAKYPFSTAVLSTSLKAARFRLRSSFTKAT